MIKKLPVFNGYTVDLRLQEFRKIKMDKLPEFVPFTSDKGADLLWQYHQTQKGRHEINKFLGRVEDF